VLHTPARQFLENLPNGDAKKPPKTKIANKDRKIDKKKDVGPLKVTLQQH
jgi:hypothetical protein